MTFLHPVRYIITGSYHSLTVTNFYRQYIRDASPKMGNPYILDLNKTKYHMTEQEME